MRLLARLQINPFWLVWSIFAALFAMILFVGATGVTPAFAAEMAAADGVVDLGPLVTTLLPIVASIAMTVWLVLRAWAFQLLKRKTGWDLDATIGPIVDQGLQRGVDFAAERLKDRAAGGIPINMKAQAIETVADYAIEKLPDALNHFGLVDGKMKPTKKLAEMIEGRLEQVLIDPEIERLSPSFEAVRAG